MIRSRRVLAAALVFVGLSLTGCATTVSLTPAAGANDPLCAEIMVRLPSTVAGQDRHWTDAQATAAWGSPSAVIMTCGVTVPGPTTDRCVTLGGVDWVVDESKSPDYRVTTYGRTPAVEVYLDSTKVDSNAVLDSIGSQIAGQIPKTGACTDPEAPPS